VDGKIDDKGLLFMPYSGIAPRQYEKVFSMHLRGAKRGYSLQYWNRNKQTLLPTYVEKKNYTYYLEIEHDLSLEAAASAEGRYI